MIKIEFSILGDIPCIKNSLRVTRGGHFYHKDDDVRCYKAAFDRQVPADCRIDLDESLAITLHIFQANHRKDAVNQSDTIWDCLQSSGVIKNDRLIEEWHCFSAIDKENPRVHIIVVQKLGGLK